MTRSFLRPTIEDLAAWRRLIEAAQFFARNPMAPAGRLTRAARTAGAAIVPPPLSRESPFVKLQREALGWGLLQGENRMAGAQALGQLAADCEAGLTPEPLRRHRADVDG